MFGEHGLEWLTDLFNVIFRLAKMPPNRELALFPLYMNEGDDCNNYRGIKMLSDTMKL